MKNLFLVRMLAMVTAPAAAYADAQPSGSFQTLPSTPPTAEILRNLPNPPRGVAAMGGRCERFEVAGVDRTARCRVLLTNMHYARGQSIQFWMNSPTGEPAGAVSFFGLEEKVSGQTTTLAVEMLTIAEGSPPAGRKARATGTCEFGDFAAGPVRVTCSAVVDGLRYGGIFITDGAPPATRKY